MSVGPGEVGMYSHNSYSVTGVPWCGVRCVWQCLLGKIAFLTGVPSMVLEDVVMIEEAEDKELCSYVLVLFVFFSNGDSYVNQNFSSVKCCACKINA